MPVVILLCHHVLPRILTHLTRCCMQRARGESLRFSASRKGRAGERECQYFSCYEPDVTKRETSWRNHSQIPVDKRKRERNRPLLSRIVLGLPKRELSCLGAGLSGEKVAGGWLPVCLICYQNAPGMFLAVAKKPKSIFLTGSFIKNCSRILFERRKNRK